MLKIVQKDDMPLVTHAFRVLLCLQVVCPWKCFFKKCFSYQKLLSFVNQYYKFQFDHIQILTLLPFCMSNCLSALHQSLIRVGLFKAGD